MRIALFGGTFNPVHLGHLLMAEAAREHFDLERVIFLPSGHPPHKASPEASAFDRLAMVRRAIRGNSALAASDWEIRQRRVVYTFETLEHFQQARPRDTLFFLMGSDSLRDIRSWREGEHLLSRCRFLIVERPEFPWTSLPPALRRKVRRVPVPPVPFSSHMIRARVRRGLSIRYQVPDAVARYIQSRRLYRHPE